MLKWGNNRHHSSKSFDARPFSNDILKNNHVTFFGGHSVHSAESETANKNLDNPTIQNRIFVTSTYKVSGKRWDKWRFID